MVVVLSLTCDMPASFGDEYKNSSTNFIAAHALAEPPLAGADPILFPLDALASWDWAWRGQTGVGNTFQYMTLDLPPYVGAGPGGSDAGLLEAINLAKNPAFSGGLTTGWIVGGGATILGTGSIHGSALQASTPLETAYVYIGDTLFLDVSASIQSYTLSLNATNILGLQFLESGLFDLQSPSWSGAGPYSLLANNIATGTSQAMGLTNSVIGNFVFDDVSAIRTDVPATKWSMLLRLSTLDTQPSLVPGTYEFTVYVRRPTLPIAPADYTFSTDATRGDSVDYASRFVTLRMTQTADGIIQTVAVQSFNITSLPDTWNRLVLRMPTGSNFTFPESTTGGVIELSISPMNPSMPEAGAVLIANPSLNFYINGY